MKRLLGLLIVGIFGAGVAVGAQEVTVSSFRFVLQGCKQNQDQVVCGVNVTNTRTSKRELGLYRPLNAQDSATFGQLYDANGLPHRLSDAGFGDLEGEVFLILPPSVPTRLEVAYKVTLKSKEIPLLSFSTSIGEVKFKQVTLQ